MVWLFVLTLSFVFIMFVKTIMLRYAKIVKSIVIIAVNFITGE